MKLNTQINGVVKAIQSNDSLMPLINELERVARSYDEDGSSPLGQMIVEFNRELNRCGVFPLKFNCTYFSQSKLAENRCLELSWQRNDLIVHKGFQTLKVPKSHGPGFRLRIFGDGALVVGLSNRFTASGDAAKSNFSKNVFQDDGYLSFFFDRIVSKYRVCLSWIDEDFEAETFSELRKYISRNHKKSANNFIYIDRVLKTGDSATPKRFAITLSKSFSELAPFLYSMLFNLHPKKSRTHTSMKGQLTREQLRNQLLECEHQCQNESCKIPKELQVLEMAHMVPSINELSNAISLCRICHGQRYPKNSVIKFDGRLSKSGNSEIYGVTVSTRVGEQHWRIKSHHKLSGF